MIDDTMATFPFELFHDANIISISICIINQLYHLIPVNFYISRDACQLIWKFHCYIPQLLLLSRFPRAAVLTLLIIIINCYLDIV